MSLKVHSYKLLDKQHVMHHALSLSDVIPRCGADSDVQGGGPTLLPPSQPALLTMTADGVMRIWVEVTVTPPPAALPAPLSPKEAPRAQQAPKAAEQVPSLCSFVNMNWMWTWQFHARNAM